MKSPYVGYCVAMRRSRLRWALFTSVAAGLIVPAGVAWACVAVMSLTTNASNLQPGDSVTVFGKSFAQDQPVMIHLDSATGPLLATVPPPESTMTSQFEVPVTLPADITPGEHLIVALQDYHHMNAGTPTRASIFVGPGAPAPPTPEARPAGVVTGPATSTTTLVLIGAAVAAGALLLAGLANRRPAHEPTPAS